jgi:transposase
VAQQARHQTGHSKQIDSETAIQFQQEVESRTTAGGERLSRLKDFRRIATRYDRLARNFLPSVYLAATIIWWVY